MIPRNYLDNYLLYKTSSPLKKHVQSFDVLESASSPPKHLASTQPIHEAVSVRTLHFSTILPPVSNLLSQEDGKSSFDAAAG
jgi:hypothetical protein